MFFNAGNMYFLSGDADDLSVCACHTCPVLFTLVNGHIYTVAEAVSEHPFIKHINVVTRQSFTCLNHVLFISHYLLGAYL